jgi:AcrR family transcriptional regulator
MSKGAQTRQEVIDRALSLAGELGLESVSLGVLSKSLGLSKSGLFAHFKSKEQLQLDVVNEAIERFNRLVVFPALAQPRGEPRLTALFEGFMGWVKGASRGSRGCIFMALSWEYDDRPGPIRDLLVSSQRDWRNTIARVVQAGIDDRHFKATTDPKLAAFEFDGVFMSFQRALKLLGDPKAEAHVRSAYRELLARLTR